MTSDHYQSAAEANYLDTLSLRCAPFENRIDPKFFYGGATLMQRLDLLAHLTQFGEPLLVVSGPPGSGKTTLLGQFASQINDRWHLCLLHGTDIEQLPAELARALGGGDVSSGLEALLDRWDTETDASQLFVLAVDDAEQLTPTACETLCRLLDKPQGERLRILLFGTAELQPMLKQALAQLGSARTPQLLEVPRLSEEETAAYLMYRLAVAGYSGESPFSTTEIRGICKAADGWPGAINSYADQTLYEHAVRAKSKKVQPRRTSAIIANRLVLPAIFVGALLVTFAGWQLFFSEDTQPGQSPESQLAKTETPLVLPKPAPLDKAEEPLPPTLPATANSVPEESAPPDRDTGRTPALPVADTSTPAEPAQQAIELPAPAVREPAPAAPAETITKESVTPAAAPPSPATAAEDTTPAPVGAPATTPLPHREAWLLAQPGDRFSLQLLGSRSEKSVTDFIARNKLDLETTAYYRGLHKGSEWFVVLYGLYPSREAALQGISSLPESVRKAKPWPRTLQAVQQSIQEAGT